MLISADLPAVSQIVTGEGEQEPYTLGHCAGLNPDRIN